MCNVRCIILKEIPVVSHNGSNYDYYFIIKELAVAFKGQFSYLGKNTEKYITFLVPIKNEIKITDKNEEEITKTLSYKLKFIDSRRFMASSLSDLVDILLNEFIKSNANIVITKW